jgi:hypothetical protein
LPINTVYPVEKKLFNSLKSQDENERIDKLLKESDYKAEKFERKTELLQKQIISLNALVTGRDSDPSNHEKYIPKHSFDYMFPLV